MTIQEVITISVYCIGVITYVITFIIQRSEIRKIKSVTDHMERYMKIFNVDEVEKYVRLKEKSFDQAMKNASHDLSEKFTAEYMEKFGNKRIQTAVKKFESELGGQINELGWYVAEWLYELPEDERETMIKEYFPKSEHLLREGIESIQKHMDAAEESKD